MHILRRGERRREHFDGGPFLTHEQRRKTKNVGIEVPGDVGVYLTSVRELNGLQKRIAAVA